jgi:uncharacterized protein YgfB (UPF0149 family)
MLFLFNVKVFQRLRGFLNTFLVELMLCESDMRLFKKSEAFSSNVRHFEQFLGFLKTFSEKL